jgi:hypothetical protein
MVFEDAGKITTLRAIGLKDCGLSTGIAPVDRPTYVRV